MADPRAPDREPRRMATSPTPGNSNNSGLTGALRLGAAAAALAAVIGPMGVVMTFMIGRVSDSERRLQAHVEGDGHPVQNERLNTVRSDLFQFKGSTLLATQGLEDKLQKEIRGQTGVRDEILRTVNASLQRAEDEREALRGRIRQLEIVLAKTGSIVP